MFGDSGDALLLRLPLGSAVSFAIASSVFVLSTIDSDGDALRHRALLDSAVAFALPALFIEMLGGNGDATRLCPIALSTGSAIAALTITFTALFIAMLGGVSHVLQHLRSPIGSTISSALTLT